jgi:hypothetical protein
LNLDLYISNILDSFFNSLTTEDRQYKYLYGKAHIADKSMFPICEVYENKIITKIFWPLKFLFFFAIIFNPGRESHTGIILP